MLMVRLKEVENVVTEPTMERVQEVVVAQEQGEDLILFPHG